MRISGHSAVALVVFVTLGGLAGFGAWYEASRSAPDERSVSSTLSSTLSVTSGADRGPGSLREALFIAATADESARIGIEVSNVVIETALPPLVNPHGISIVGAKSGTQIDASGVDTGAVFDVNGAGSSIEGLTIRGCTGAAVLLRAPRFRMTRATVESCDVGVEVTANASDVLLQGDDFIGNRIGVRFEASVSDALVLGNVFTGHTDAGIWAVAGEMSAGGPIAVRDNEFREGRMGVVAGNVSVLIERNKFVKSHETAVYLIGDGVAAKNNRVSEGGSMGIVAEHARGAVIEGNELDHLAAYAIMIRGSSNSLVRGNRIHNCAYGVGFVLGDERSPSTAVENSIIEAQYRGIDVIGDSPILRRNRVVGAHASAFHQEDFSEGGRIVHSAPFLENNEFGAAEEVANSHAGTLPENSEDHSVVAK